MDHADVEVIGGEEICRHRDRMLRFARARLRNPAHAEDAVQDALVAAIEAGGSFGGRAALGTWLTGILKHKIVDCVRRGARDAYEPLFEDTGGHAAGNPEQSLCARQSLAEVDRRLAELPPRTAEVLLMRDVLGMSTEEACRALSITSNHCAVLLHRARRRLRASLADDGLEAIA
ncbi:MAG: sigma-70 family RNA polymerase sigma factor [Betaproteobacteria bacterium]